MKKLCALLITALLGSGAAFAQCDKNVVYHSDKQEILNPDGQVQDNKSDAITMEFTKEKIVLTVPERGDAINATIKETDCQWKEVYKEGKVTYKAAFQKGDGSETSDGTLIIEAKDGKLTILVEIVKMGGRKIRLSIAKYEEK